MADRAVSHRRENGVYYTPLLLARSLAEPLITSPKLTILDPAYGDGALILAAEEILKEKFQTKKKNILFGCDLSPLSTRTQHLPKLNFAKCDFFDYSTAHKYDLILMNPPYVRHHYLNSDRVDHYQDAIENIFSPKRTTDLWAYFLVKATTHLKENGSIGAILPWSFLHADYSVELRKWLISQFREIKVLVLTTSLFDDAKERVVLVWMKGFETPNQRLLMGSAPTPEDHVRYYSISANNFTRNRINLSFSSDAFEIIEKYKLQYGFHEFRDYSEILIGVVTGADNFFIRNKDDLSAMGYSIKGMIPIFTNSSQFSGFSVNGNRPNSRLMLIRKDNAPKFKNYIKYGESQNYHLRAHSQRRECWYQVDAGDKPDAFFPYRVSLIPYLVLNKYRDQCTNSIHRVYFKKNITATEKKWLQVSLLSLPGQLSLEANSRVYGSGVLKIEPGALKQAICFTSRNRTIDSVYNQISRLLQIYNRKEAMRVASAFIQDSLGIDKRLSSQTENVYNELLSKRKKGKIKMLG